MQIDAITKWDAERIATSKVCEELPKDEWFEEGSVLFALRRAEEEIKALKVSDGINSSAIEMLLERVKVLENAIVDIRDGMYGLKEINDTIRNLKKEVEKL